MTSTTCKDAVIDAVTEIGGVVSASDVINHIYKKYPGKPWKENSIRHHLVGLSVNHKSSIHHPTLHRQACLYYLGNSKYQLHKPDVGHDQIKQVATENQGNENDNNQATISLERDLEDYLTRDLSQIEKGLRLFTDKNISGRQYDTGEVGRIDILALDKNDNYVVIELKAGTANSPVIGQILGYINWVRQNLADGREVRGIVIADDFDKRVRYASAELRDFSLKKYEVSFKITEV